MKLFQILFLLITFQSVSFSSYLLDKNTPICIEDFYYKSSRIYFQKSSNLKWSSTSEDHTSDHLRIGYVYDSTNKICKPDVNLILGMDIKDFNFLLGLIGVIFGSVFMFFTIQAFITVGGKK